RVAARACRCAAEFPAGLARTPQAFVDPEPAIGRMRVRSVPGDEGAPDPIALGDRYSQVPEPDVVERASKLEAGDALQQGVNVEIVGGGVRRHRGVEEPAFADVDAAEKLPV